MNKNNKHIILFGVIVMGLILAYFLFNMYTDNRYAKELPNVPDLNGTALSFQKYIKNANVGVQDKPDAGNLGELGMIYQSNNYLVEAEACYLLAIERSPKDWVWLYYLGCLERELGDSEKAIIHFNNVLEINSNVYMARYYLGEAYSQMGLIDKSKAALSEISILDNKYFNLKNTKRTSYFPLPVYASLELAKGYCNADKIELAEKQLKQLITQQITFSPAYKQLSIIYAEKGEVALSDYYTNRSKDLNIYTSPVDTLQDKLSYYSKSETYLLKQIEDAIKSSNSLWALELVTQGLKNIPESKYITSKAIKLFIDMKAEKSALPLLDKHLKDFSENYHELIEVGVRLANSGLKNEAKTYFMLAQKIKGQKAATQSTLAGMYNEKLGMKEKALGLINKLLEQYPNNIAVLSDAIFLFLQTEDIGNAKKYLKRLERVDPQNVDINVFNGLVSSNAGAVKQSVRYFEKAFKSNPEKKFIINYLSDYYQKNKMWNELVDLYITALKFSPNDSSMQEAYGSLLINCPDETIRNSSLAREFSERAFINSRYTLQTRVSAGRSLAIAYFELKDYGKALYYMHKTIKIAKRARFSKEYVVGLEQISNDIQGLINSNK